MNELTVINPSVPAFSMGDVEKIAGAIAKSGMFGLKDPYSILTLCLLAQAEGQHPAVVFRDYSIISGKPAKKAEAMLRDFIQSGGKVQWHSLSDECADATFSHPGGGTVRISWDHARAKKAGLGSNGMYAKYPRQMLRSRTISEGVRTVFPGATSGLYVPEEVTAFEPANGELPAHNGETGELIEAQPERQKVPGITKIKERLSKLMREGNKIAADQVGALETFNAMVSESKDDLTAIKEANHEYWTGDGDDSEGFKAWIRRRREEMAEPAAETSLGLKMLLSALDQCATRNDLSDLLDQHGTVAEALDGEESRKWEAAYNAREAAIMETATLGAG